MFPEKEMCRIYATWIVAAMQDVLTKRNSTSMNQPRDSMGSLKSPIQPELPIASFSLPANPLPARTGDLVNFDFSPETPLKRNGAESTTDSRLL